MLGMLGLGAIGITACPTATGRAFINDMGYVAGASLIQEGIAGELNPASQPTQINIVGEQEENSSSNKVSLYPGNDLKLNHPVIWRKDGSISIEECALINEKLYSVGESINDFRVYDVTNNSVILLHKNGECYRLDIGK